MKNGLGGKLFLICFRSYKVSHTIFNILWSLRFVDGKILWWVWWGIAGVFLVLLIANKSLNNYVNAKSNVVDRVITVLWIVSGGISGNVHSPRL